MHKIIQALILFLILLCLPTHSFAKVSYSCTDEATPVIIPTSDVFSQKILSNILISFSMRDIDAEGEIITTSSDIYTKLPSYYKTLLGSLYNGFGLQAYDTTPTSVTRCEIPTDDIKFSYYPISLEVINDILNVDGVLNNNPKTVKDDTDRPKKEDTDRPKKEDMDRPKKEDTDKTVKEDESKTVKNGDDKTVKEDTDRPTKEALNGFTKETITLTPGQIVTLPTIAPSVKFRAVREGTKICVQAFTNSGWLKIGCKVSLTPEVFAAGAGKGKSCFANKTSCADATKSKAMSMLPISSMVIQCVKESLYEVFMNPCSECSTANLSGINLSTFPKFQDAMRSTIRAAILLYVILFGIKIALGGDIPKKSDIFMFFMKFILVIYFSVGFTPGSSELTDCSKYEQKDGLSQFVLPAAMGTSRSFINYIITAAAATNGLCNYNPSNYDGDNYEDLFIWDALDCRIAYYLGVANPNSAPMLVQAFLMKMIFWGFAAFQIMFVILSMVVALFLLSVTVYFVHYYVIALIVVTLVVYMGPIFIPMALFEKTKQYFDGWLRTLFAYTLQPAIIAAFLALMMGTFDQIYYGDCQFVEQKIIIPIPTKVDDGSEYGRIDFINKEVPYFIISSASKTAASCTDSFGYKMSTYMQSDSIAEQIIGTFFNYKMLSISFIKSAFNALVQIALFAYLFYHFSSVIGQLAADLSGGPSLNQFTGGAMGVVNLAKQLLEKYIDAQTGGAYSKAKEAKAQFDKATGEDKGSSGTTVARGGANEAATSNGGGGGSGGSAPPSGGSGDSGGSTPPPAPTT
jgi:type IV secretion system protein VirB6